MDADVECALDRYLLYREFGWTPADLADVPWHEAQQMLLLHRAITEYQQQQQQQAGGAPAPESREAVLAKFHLLTQQQATLPPAPLPE